MSKLTWDDAGKRRYESGVSKGVLYPQDNDKYPKGYAWNGLTGVTESPDGAEPTDLWADNMKYASMRSAETFGGTIEAYTYPDEFAECDGSKTVDGAPGLKIGQQERKSFGLCYRTEIGTDTNANAGYLLHLIYNATCSPSEKAYETINDSPDAITMSWEFDTTPIEIKNRSTLKHTSVLTIDSTKFTTAETKARLTALEDKLYGTDGADGKDPELPLPHEVIAILTGTQASNP